MSTSKQRNKAALARGAETIRKAESEAATVKAGKLDGTLGSVVKEITRLHSEILLSARTSLQKAMRVGELLCRVRASRRGKWLDWLEQNVSFSRRTAYNYLSCFDRRESLQMLQITDLSEVYALLNAPKREPVKRHKKQIEQSDDGVPAGVVGSEQSEPVEPEQPVRRHKSQKQIIKELQKLTKQEQQAEQQTHEQLGAIIEKLSRKVRAAWLEFPDHLTAHGNALTDLAERLRLNTPRHTQ